MASRSHAIPFGPLDVAPHRPSSTDQAHAERSIIALCNEVASHVTQHLQSPRSDSGGTTAVLASVISSDARLTRAFDRMKAASGRELYVLLDIWARLPRRVS